MPEILEKLRPDRDLQCYFERPSAVAALSAVSATGFTVSGNWRQQFDWAVIEWNRDNVFEHPSFRNLPDGDLSGLTLSYDEERTNAMALDSGVYPTVDWPYLRIWAETGGGEQFFQVPLKNYAAAIEGAYAAAWAEFELTGSPTGGDYVGLAWGSEHHTYQLYGTDTLESAVQAIVDSVNAFSATMTATRTAARIRLTSVTPGADGNRIGVYGFVAGTKTEAWTPGWQRLSGGTSPTKWRITLPFGALSDRYGAAVPMSAVRKIRWTYAADFQMGQFAPGEFQVRVSNWTVSGTGRAYAVAGAGSQRIEDDAAAVVYSAGWAVWRGNYSGGSIHYTSAPGASLSCDYHTAGAHTLYLGTRRASDAPPASVSVDGLPPVTLALPLNDNAALCRVRVGDYGAGPHTVTVAHAGAAGTLFFDFLEVAYPEAELPAIEPDPGLSLATDWDTDHSISLAPERTAWMIHSLGLRGRMNHYAGALWFYDLVRVGHQYASGSVTFTGTPVFSAITELRIGRTGLPPESDTVFQHVNTIGDTAETIARYFEMEINRGATAVRAEVAGNVLSIYSRTMGADGNQVTLAASPTSGEFVAQASGPALAGGVDGAWRTDLGASPRINRAARDWHRSYFAALAGYGMDAVAAFSMELQHGDPSVAAGIAQRYPSGAAVELSTPALQTNFSPTSLTFWKEVYREMAGLMVEGGLVPFLQFGEVQWWYFPSDGSGMPFYDAYTQDAFRAAYGRDMAVIPNNSVPVASYPDEAAFLPALIGGFTGQILDYVRASYPGCRFEVLYPPDVNETEFNRAINLPLAEWTPARLDCFKTENFTYTYARNVDKSRESLALAETLGFPRSKRAHLVGVGDSTASWRREARAARAEGLESVVLFALDQFALIGYEAPVGRGLRRAVYFG